MKGCIQQWVCFALEFCQSRTNHRAAFLPQLKAFKTRFGNEFGPSSLAADWGNHGCFLFLRWVICLSSAGSPAALRSVNKNTMFWKRDFWVTPLKKQVSWCVSLDLSSKEIFLNWHFFEQAEARSKMQNTDVVLLVIFNQASDSLFGFVNKKARSLADLSTRGLFFCCSTLRCGMHGDDSWRASPMRLLRSKIR